MAFEQSSLKLGLQSLTSGQISSGLDLPYAPSIITTQQPTEGELDLLFKAMYDDHIGGQPSAAPRTIPLLNHSFLQNSTATITTAYLSHTYKFTLSSNQYSKLLTECLTLRTQQKMVRPHLLQLQTITMEPKNVNEAMTDPAWIESMQEELLQFKRLDVWVLVPPPDHIKPLTLKWLLKNKHDERTRHPNKNRLDCEWVPPRRKE
ncbi:hypothetical protein Tco_0971309 [Tanacetum coccineum]